MSDVYTTATAYGRAICRLANAERHLDAIANGTASPILAKSRDFWVATKLRATSDVESTGAAARAAYEAAQAAGRAQRAARCAA